MLQYFVRSLLTSSYITLQVHDPARDILAVHVLLVHELHCGAGPDDAGGLHRVILLGLREAPGHPRVPHPGCPL